MELLFVQMHKRIYQEIKLQLSGTSTLLKIIWGLKLQNC